MLALITASVGLSPLATGQDAQPQVLQAVALRFGDGAGEVAATHAAVTAPLKTALLETYTATWCLPCGPSERALDTLFQERGGPARTATTEPSPGSAEGNQTTTNETAPHTPPGDDDPAAAGRSNDAAVPDFVFLAYHPWPDVSGNDPFGIPEGDDRMRTRYDASWFPTTVVDATYVDRPASRTQATRFDAQGIYEASYAGLIDSALRLPAQVSLELRATPSADGDLVVLEASATATQAIPGPLHLVFVVWEDGIVYEGGNGVGTQHMVVRDLLPAAADLDGLAEGETWTATATWQAQPDDDPSRFGATAFVEIPSPATSQTDDATVYVLYMAAVVVVASAAIFLARRR